MSLLGSSKTECYTCGQEIEDEEEAIHEDGHVFGCEECKEKYEDQEKSEDKEVCQFC